MEADLWDVSYLYRIMAFRKISGKDIAGVKREYHGKDYVKVFNKDDGPKEAGGEEVKMDKKKAMQERLKMMNAKKHQAAVG